MRRFALFAIVVFVAAMPAARGDLIDNLATGLNGLGNLQSAGGSTDANWTYSDPSTGDSGRPATGQAEVVASNSTDWYGGWLANGPNSDWIAVNPNVTNNGPAPYSFSTTFNLTGYSLGSVVVSGSWAIDDQGTVSLNGNTIGTIGNGQWGGLTSFSAPISDLNQGLNTLTITITSDDQFLEAVRLQGSVTGSAAVVPEPGTWAMAVTAGVLGAFHSCRRRSRKATES